HENIPEEYPQKQYYRFAPEHDRHPLGFVRQHPNETVEPFTFRLRKRKDIMRPHIEEEIERQMAYTTHDIREHPVVDTEKKHGKACAPLGHHREHVRYDHDQIVLRYSTPVGEYLQHRRSPRTYSHEPLRKIRRIAQQRQISDVRIYLELFAERRGAG